jgi:LmbE family N-acetylglucosaminyl deacetylase
MEKIYSTILMGIMVFSQGFFSILAQPIKELNASEVQLSLNKLTVLGSVLYVAAHPDDENTRVIAYFDNGRLVRSGYLAMTRGDGGQNLIGSEKGELLGLIRTRELLAAREIDGGEQFFTRAIDFGYSKSPEETLRIWDREKVLEDVVRIIRNFRPDIIITRFTPELGGHGHHRASAILAKEAFQAAGDSTRFPEQLQYVEPWQPKRIYWNGWRRALEREGADLSKFPAVDVGEYDPLLGQSYFELAAKSRSMHKSQGFGMEGYRGTYQEYFQDMAGDTKQGDLFEGVNTTWSRISGGEAVGEVLGEASETFDPQHPSATLPLLLKAYQMLEELPPDPWVEVKRRDLKQTIRACAGIWYEAIAEEYSAPPGSAVKLTPMMVNRSDFSMTLEKIRLPHAASDTLLNHSLANNQPFDIKTSFYLPENAEYSQPYWLQSKPSKGTFEVADLKLIGLAENPPQLTVKFTVLLDQTRLEFETPVSYRWRDPVEGELYRPFEVVPPVTVNFEDNLFVFGESRRKEMRLRIRSGKPAISGTLRLKMPLGWVSNVKEIPFSFEKKDEETVRSILITPPATPMTRYLTAEVDINGIQPARSRVRIEHSHIPIQVLFPPAELKLVRINLKKTKRRIGYIMGSGDEIPGALRQIGYNVTLLSDEDLSNGDLKRFDVIITGIRAYNTRDRLAQAQKQLLNFVKSGGTLIVQYNVFGLVTEELGPYPFKISRERVSVEGAPVEFMDFNHRLFTYPNQILQKDFTKWVQERGLYFASEWDSAYQPLLSSHDPGEKALRGGLLYAQYGQGVYIYTGYSWFRQLPAGVPGAYRFFVNMISAGAAE